MEKPMVWEVEGDTFRAALKREARKCGARVTERRKGSRFTIEVDSRSVSFVTALRDQGFGEELKLYRRLPGIVW